MHLSEFHRYRSCFQCYCSGGFLSLNPDVMALPCSLPGASFSALLRQELLTLGSTWPTRPTCSHHPPTRQAGRWELCSRAPASRPPRWHKWTAGATGELIPQHPQPQRVILVNKHVHCLCMATVVSAACMPLSTEGGGGCSATAGCFRPTLSGVAPFCLSCRGTQQQDGALSGPAQPLDGAIVGPAPSPLVCKICLNSD